MSQALERSLCETCSDFCSKDMEAVSKFAQKVSSIDLAEFTVGAVITLPGKWLNELDYPSLK